MKSLREKLRFWCSWIAPETRHNGQRKKYPPLVLRIPDGKEVVLKLDDDGIPTGPPTLRYRNVHRKRPDEEEA